MARPKALPDRESVLLRLDPAELEQIDQLAAWLEISRAKAAARVLTAGMGAFKAELLGPKQTLLLPSQYGSTFLVLRAEPRRAALVNHIINLWSGNDV